MGELPRNLDAEEALVGSSLVAGDIPGLALQVEPEHFSSSFCAELWKATLYLKNRGDPIDILTVGSTLENMSSFDEIETYAKITRLISQVPSSVHIEKYAALVLTMEARRRLAQSLPNLSKIAYGGIAQNPSEVFSLAAAEIENAREGMGKSDRELWTASELAGLEISKDPWLVDGLLVKGGLNLLAGETRAGKTFACLDLAICMSEGGGIAWGRKVRSGSLIYFGADNARNDLIRRIRALSAGREIMIPKGEFLIDLDPLDLGSAQSFSIIENSIKSHAPKLVIFDALVRYMGSLDENNAQDVSRMMARFRNLANNYECAFLFVHHLSKLSGRQAWSRLIDRSRGSGDFMGAVDSGFVMTISGRSPNHKRHLTHVKGRIDVESEPLKFNIIKVCDDSTRLVFDRTEVQPQQETLIDQCINVWLPALKASPGKKFSTSELNNMLHEDGIKPSESTFKNARSELKRIDGINISRDGRKNTFWYRNDQVLSRTD